MKIVTYCAHADGPERLGFLTGESVVDALAALPAGAATAHFGDAVAFIRGGSAALAQAHQVIDHAPASARLPLAAVQLRAPLRPSTIICSGSNYRTHNAEKANTPLSGKEPEFFIKTADCVVGPGEGIVYDPLLTHKLDCETELAIVIGRPGRHIPVASALEHVFGYTIVNDVTARDRQVRRSPQGFTWYELGRGKAFDSSAPLGPCIVTADEIPDPQALMLRTRINGEQRQACSTAEMIWSCAYLVHYFSCNFTLKPGMVIITGTPAGTAWSTDTDLGGKWQGAPGLVPATRYCLPGDRVESEIEGIGVLRNPVVSLSA
ncbi:MAG: FAA hydrolase family protein [Gammaproteobacteria bacterium]|nr:FAA hydrolase family protein [Gammaproteobacteria bacterium]